MVLASARDLRITLPKRTQATPVQQLNREGVKAIKKHQLEKAEKLFYRAYLIDPDDPFTLNNLGYISELQGKIDRAQRYYQLAVRENNSETVIAAASIPGVQGQSLAQFTGTYAARDLRSNRGNIEAMNLLQQGRAQEADEALKQTLTLDPQNPFTLNNLGYTMEEEGDLQSALRYYSEAAGTHSSEKIVVALDPHWRGRPISEQAASNAEAVRKRLDNAEPVEAAAARLNLQGVYALNHNNAQRARWFFEQAYKLNPQSAFSLNNIGYVSEMDGDQETAGQFYLAAKEAAGSRERVAVASHSEMRGMSLTQVADANDQDTQANLEAQREARRRQNRPIQLLNRDQSPVAEPQTPLSPPNE
jgi:Flp pilus assembly protein TadD